MNMMSHVKVCFRQPTMFWVGANQPVHKLLRGKGLGIQQGTSVWVGSPKSHVLLMKVGELTIDLHALKLGSPPLG